MIGLIISDLSNPYYSTLAGAIEESLRAQNYMLIVSSSEESGERHDHLLDRLMEQRVDGLIVVPPREPGRPYSEIPPPIPPVVFLDRPGDYRDADVVLADNAGGATEAVTVLHKAGARRIAFLGDSPEIYTIRERLDGFRQARAALGLALDDELVFTGAHSRADAATTVEEILRRNTADAIFAANNRAAIGALEAFHRRGTRLPLVGFDDFEAAHLIGHGLTVVSQDIERMGRDAAELLLARLQGDRGPYRTLTLRTSLVVRGSERAALDSA